jgi:uncharacterized protein
MMKSLLSAATLAAALAVLPGCATTSASSTASKVVFQVSDDDAQKWNLALNNAKNVQVAMGAGATVEIVAYGPGIGMLTADSSASNRVAAAAKSGVKVVACQNTMRAKKLSPADMNTAIGYVPSGVVEIMAKQQQGWSYVRP